MPNCTFCRARFDGGDAGIFRVPRDLERRQLWEEALDVTLAEGSRICQQHFGPNDFKVTTNKKKAPKRMRLMPNAVPLKISAFQSADGRHKDAGSQTDSDTIHAGIVLENIRMQRQISALQKENAALRQEIEKMKSLKESVSKIFTENQLIKLMGGDKKKFWNSTDISYGICLHTAGPRAYNHLYKKGFPLPSIATLKRWLAKVQIETGTLDVAIDLMAQNVELSEDEKICVLLFDEMKIASPRNHVQMAVVRGLTKSWKQPVYFDFDCRMKMKTLNEIIVKLYKAGYPVVAIVSDLRKPNLKLWRDLDITDTKPWFPNPSNEDLKIFAFVDAPHLIKLVRNQFIGSGLLINGKTITTQTVQQAMTYASSSDKSVEFKITEDHLNDRSTARQKIKLATQLFSNTTASALRRCFSLGLDLIDACDTADFFKLTNDWFDVFNSKLSTAKALSTTQPYGKHLDVQRSLLSDMTKIMSKSIIPHSAEIAPFQRGILVNNASLDGLYSYLADKYKVEYILTNRVTQDVLHQFFGAMRGNGGLHDHPTPLQFKYRLRKYLVGISF